MRDEHIVRRATTVDEKAAPIFIGLTVSYRWHHIGPKEPRRG